MSQLAFRTAIEEAAPADALAGAIAEVQAQGAARAARLRLFGAAAFLVSVGGIALVTGRHDWAIYLEPLALYLVLAILVFSGRRGAFAVRLATLAAASDVSLIWHMQSEALPLSPFPAGVAGFTLALFALVVVLNAAPLRPGLVYLSALFGTAAELALMEQAGISGEASLAGALVLGVLAVATSALTVRVRSTVAELANAEVSRRLAERRAEEEARDRTAHAARAEALMAAQRERELLTQLLVHDLRSPLTALVGNIDYLAYKLERAGQPEAMLSLADNARKTAMRLAEMIGDLLDLSKLEDGSFPLQRRPTRIGELVKEVCTQAEGMLAGREVAVLTPSPDVRLDVDGKLLRRVAENLVTNAARYTPAKGRVEVRAAVSGGTLQLRFRNQGPAIPDELRERLFEKYARAGAKGGSGLGLYFCRLAVEAHGGTIALEEAAGWDVAFLVALPVRGETGT